MISIKKNMHSRKVGKYTSCELRLRPIYPNKNKMCIYSIFQQTSIEHPVGVRCCTDLNGGDKKMPQ